VACLTMVHFSLSTRRYRAHDRPILPNVKILKKAPISNDEV